MLRRSARSAGVAPRNEDADHGVEPENEAEACGHVGRRDEVEAGAEGGAAGEGERKEPSELDEDEGSGDGVADAGVGGGQSTEVGGAVGGALAENESGCDACAIKESTIQGLWSRLRGVRLEVVQARTEITRIQPKPPSSTRWRAPVLGCGA